MFIAGGAHQEQSGHADHQASSTYARPSAIKLPQEVWAAVRRSPEAQGGLVQDHLGTNSVTVMMAADMTLGST